MPDRKCPIRGCGVTIPAEKFSCHKHWFSMNPRQRSIIWSAYRDWLAGRITGDGLKRIQDDVLAEIATGKQVTAEAVPCSGCGAPILWFRTALNDSRCPIDAEPYPTGNIVIREGKVVYLTQSLFDAEGKAREGEVRYRSHFATCPRAGEFRTKKRG